MDVSHIFDPLNEVQREAVSAPVGPLLVLAGAGSGKTRVLTHRIAWLIQGLEAAPLSIVAVTFTNKAAREMRGRVEELLQLPTNGLWMGTFHGVCHRLLRRHRDEAGLAEGFEIMDSDDQYRLVRRVLRELNLSEDYWPPRQMQWMINHHKEEARRSHQLPAGNDSQQQTMHQIYAAYETLCRRFDLVDFAEILLRTLELFRNNQTIRETYQQRFQHVLVDEFQDTNSIQYQWVKLLAGQHQNLFVVGDDDQSIYGWRGARVENILSFEQDFPAAKVFRLEQNYRSSGNILGAANAVIAHNAGRLGKELWTEAAEGSPIRVYAATNEIDEARFAVNQVAEWVAKGNRRDETAILYRSNAQSRVFEEQLMAQDIPYRVYGGQRFFDRAEIKDALAYLRLIANRDSDPAFERIVNLPPRGIGHKTVGIIRDTARRQQISMWQATSEIITHHELPPRALSAVSAFQDLIRGLTEQTQGLDLAGITEHVLHHSELMAHYSKDRSEAQRGRVENLEELVNAARNFVTDANEASEDEVDDLTLFLTHTALEAGDGQAEEWQDCVQLMSLHSAKGLEFPLVLLCGMEEGLFPHQRAVEEDGRLEEERRLCYVGMTRARAQLYLCYAEVRRLYGQENYTRPSRFLTEIPQRFTEEIRSPRISRPLIGRPGLSGLARNNGERSNAELETGLAPGKLVRHRKFGEGTVVNLEGQGNHARVLVNFAEAGPKWLVCAFANLEAV